MASEPDECIGFQFYVLYPALSRDTAGFHPEWFPWVRLPPWVQSICKNMTLEQISDAFLRDRETPLHEVVGMHQEQKPKNIKNMKVKEIEQLVAQLDAPKLIEVRMHHSQVTMAFHMMTGASCGMPRARLRREP